MKFLASLIALVIVVVVVLFGLSGGTHLSVQPAVKAVGMATPVKLRMENPHGVRRITAWVEQGGAHHKIFEQSASSHRVMFWRHHDAPGEVTFEAGKNKAPALKDGKARMIVEAVSNDFRGRSDRLEWEVEVATQPPRVQPDELQHYINQGGAELITFLPSGYWTDSGAKVREQHFRSFPLPGKSGWRFSIFPYAWDMPVETAPLVYATNPTGTETIGRFWFRIFPKKFRLREMDLSDAFLEKVVNQIDPGGQGDLLQRFLKINGELRRKNNQTLADLRWKTEEKVLWHGAFIHWGKEEALFADVRDYIYKGKKVDRQVHLGFDLPDLAHSPVNAANDGRVIYAGDLGIFGNCIVLDHGYTVQSIYGHLSEINVKVGEMVKKGQPMGRSGSTGLAGGDHLHFGMQVNGVQVNPVEWWDEHWIKDRILSKLNQ
ncbi:MAG: M23 family metallopeptidase [Acidobacteria bacterium]|nr:M23 family metallopeptidase [Acidobacteriota bacterium]